MKPALYVFFAVVISLVASRALSDPLDDAARAYKAKDYTRAIAIWQPLAESGSSIAQVKLAEMYIVGVGVARDLAIGVGWLRRSADQGNSEAQDWLGDCYRAGRGCLKISS